MTTFTRANNGIHAICTDKNDRWYGWVFRQVNGQWVSERKATERELQDAMRIHNAAEYYHGLPCPIPQEVKHD